MYLKHDKLILYNKRRRIRININVSMELNGRYLSFEESNLLYLTIPDFFCLQTYQLTKAKGISMKKILFDQYCMHNFMQNLKFYSMARLCTSCASNKF